MRSDAVKENTVGFSSLNVEAREIYSTTWNSRFYYHQEVLRKLEYRKAENGKC